jgi:hypothetical protein
LTFGRWFAVFFCLLQVEGRGGEKGLHARHDVEGDRKEEKRDKVRGREGQMSLVSTEGAMRRQGVQMEEEMKSET